MSVVGMRSARRNPLSPDDVALHCRPFMTAADIGLKDAEVDTDSDEFKECVPICFSCQSDIHTFLGFTGSSGGWNL